MADAYRVLNVSPTAPASAIRSAYLELACQHHPCKLSDGQDINPNANHTQFRLAAEAYALVGDDSRRELYDLIKSSELFRTGAGRYVHEEEGGGGLAKDGLGQPAAGRSRARSELTVDLRAGLPAELRAFLMDLDPVKVFNRVVCQIDQERRAQQAENPASSSSSSRLKPNNPVLPQSKYLSPPSHHLDERFFPRAAHGKPSTGGAVREEGAPGKQQPLNGALKTGGILRDERSKSQFRRSPSGQSDLLSEPYQRLVVSSESTRDSRGHSRSSSSYISSRASPTSAGGGRQGSGRRVSFSNDVIESDQIKQAREAVKSLKSEAARNAPKPPIFINPASPPSNSAALEVNSSSTRGLVNKLGSLNIQGVVTSPSSSYTKANEFLLDKSLYSGSRSSALDLTAQDGSIKAMGLGGGSSRDVHRAPTPGHSGASSHALMGRNMSGSRGEREGPEDARHDFLASSAPTGFLARYRLEQDLLLDAPRNPLLNPPDHLHHPPPRLHHIHHSFPWSDPNFDNPRSILLNHTTRQVN